MAYGPIARRWFQTFAKVHGALLVRTDGRPHRLGRSQYALVLVTVGAKTGRQRVVPLLYMPDDDPAADERAFVLIASNYGQERPPSWYFNLRATPDAEVRVAGRRLEVRAHELLGEERAAMLERCAAYNKQWRDYRTSVSRHLPVLRLVAR